MYGHNLFVLLFYFDLLLHCLISLMQLWPCVTSDYNCASVWWCVRGCLTCVRVSLHTDVCVLHVNVLCRFVCLSDHLKSPRSLWCQRSRPSHLSSVLFFLSSLNAGIEVLNLEEITSPGQLRGTITRQNVRGRQHLSAASHINETLQRKRKIQYSASTTASSMQSVYMKRGSTSDDLSLVKRPTWNVTQMQKLYIQLMFWTYCSHKHST